MLHHHYCEPDEECIRLFIHGDPRGFTELVNEHRQELFGYVNGYVRDRQDTEDIIQNVVIDLYTFLLSGKYHEEGKFLHLLKRMAHERTIDFLRRRSRNRKLFIPLDTTKLFEEETGDDTAEPENAAAPEPDEQPEDSHAQEELKQVLKD
ncbi:MAG: sigma-70 family RNA polymerase sigma factor, partial [Bacteroidia bacterium]|nr:sigma-70 family RNA polymerase sigma factor [Bacteroidia bacterium]